MDTSTIQDSATVNVSDPVVPVIPIGVPTPAETAAEEAAEEKAEAAEAAEVAGAAPVANPDGSSRV